ncbi:flagellar basal body-associated protein FliL [uncultured Helicobacter sp.]|uniref:flagellar basal body-associated protein FliL n=1 Tax=uncultured Helicobacter sp. TaxID=175537 RepID=UPI001C3BEAFD|nr:flagellar basal body-associated protein FliL [Candidatus Helicobacter avicola]
MAEEQEAASSPAGNEKKNKAILFIIIGMVVVFLLLIGILVAVIMLSGGNHQEPQAAPVVQQEPQAQKTVVNVGSSVTARASDYGKMGPIFPIAEEFKVNLLTQTGKKILITRVSLELDKPESQPEIETKLPVLCDAIIEILSSKSFEEVATTKGKNRVKDEIVQRLNEFLIDGSIKNIYFTSFLIG